MMAWAGLKMFPQEKLISSSYCIVKWFHHVKFIGVRVMFIQYCEVINWRVCFEILGCCSYQGGCNSRLTQPIQTMIIHNTELIKVFISNLHPVITNGVIIIDFVFKIGNKGPNKIILPFVKRFQCIGVCLVMEI